MALGATRLANSAALSDRKISPDLEVSREPTPFFIHRLALDRPRQPASATGVVSRRVSSSFTVTGQVTNPTTFNISQLEQPQFAPAQANVTYFAAGSVVTESFTGALVWDLLNNSPVGGIVTDPTIKNDILHKIVIVTGTDCYQSVFGAGEFDSFFGGSQIMVAYLSGGQPLGSAGFARIVVPGDKAGGLSRILPISTSRTPAATLRPASPSGKADRSLLVFSRDRVSFQLFVRSYPCRS